MARHQPIVMQAHPLLWVVPLTAADLIEGLTSLPEARRVAAVRPVSTSIVLSGVENAATGPANDRTFRSRWRERHGGGATERLLVADDAARPGCVTVLSPIEGGGPVRLVDSGALGDLLRRVAGRPRLEVVRELADELDRLDLRIGPAQRFALDILREPTVLLPPDADRAEQAVTFERSSTVRHALSTMRAKLGDGLISRDDAAVQVVEVVETFGLQPVQPAPRRDPITEDDVGVLCWMAVLPPSPAVK